MERRLEDVFDDLDLSETDRLLDENMKIDMNSAISRRIKAAAYKKAGLRATKRFLVRKLATVAAVVTLAVFTMSLFGFNNIANALGELFRFIPGYGIVEDDSIEYVIDEQDVKSENDQVTMTLKNAIATKDGITITMEIERKDYDESTAMEEKKKEMDDIGKYRFRQPTFLLYTESKKYESKSWSMGSGGKVDIATIFFSMDSIDINTQTEYRFNYGNGYLEAVFKLKKYESFNSLNEIGATDIHNNISITAVSSMKDGRLEVELYPINKTDYNISSFNKVYDKGYNGKDLSLLTSSSTKPYIEPGTCMGPNKEFSFDVSPEDKNLILEIPYIVVESKESRNVTLNIPEPGKKITVNKELKFKDSSMIINSVERVKMKDNEDDALKMDISYKNGDSAKIMFAAQFFRTNAFGMTQGGGYSTEIDENDIVHTVYYYLEKGEDRRLRLKVDKPSYYLLGDYKLELDR